MYVAAVRNRKLKYPDNDAELYEISMDKEEALEQEFLPHTQDFRPALKFCRIIFRF